MADSAYESTAADESRELPPIRIHHFLAWTAVMAVMLAAQRAWYAGGAAGIPSAVPTTIIAMGTVHSVLSSLAVTIVLFGIYWRRIGLPFFTEPGQWLLVALAAPTLLSLALSGIVQFVLMSMAQDRQTTFSLPVAGFFALIGFGTILFSFALNIYIGRRKISLPAWQRVFYAKSVASFIPLLGDLAVAVFLERAVRSNQRIQPARQMFAPTATTAETAIVHYHWTHRAGVWLQFVYIAYTWLNTLLTIGFMLYGVK